MTTRVAAATGHPRLLLVSLYGNMLVQRLGTSSTSGEGSAETFGVKKDPIFGNALGDGYWRGRAPFTARPKPFAVVKFFAGR